MLETSLLIIEKFLVYIEFCKKISYNLIHRIKKGGQKGCITILI